jgi:glycosyltransferase involved in cell wall biosynthesis
MPKFEANLYTTIVKYENKALHNTNRIFVASTWLYRELVRTDFAFEKKITVIERGASLASPFNSQKEIIALLNKKQNNVCNILFSNSIWLRKGGDIVIEVCKFLKEQNFNFVLHIIGTKPPEEVLCYDFVVYHGKLNLGDSYDLEKYNSIFQETHFLFVPTRAEGFGIVYAEAASFGVPSIATNIMGVESSVINGITGQRFEIEASSEIYGGYIIDTFNDRMKYNRLALSSFDYYNEHFKWYVNVKKLISLF